MIKKIVLWITVIVCCVSIFGMSACGNGTVKEHTHTFGDYVLNADATCVDDATKTARCTYKGCTETDTVPAAGSALGHNFVSYIPDYNATCLAKGTKTAVCTRENCTATDSITNDNDPPHGHRFVEYTDDNNAGCVMNGTKTAICSYPDCSETDTVTNINDPARGHVFEVYVSDGNADCVTDGTKTAVCSHSGCSETDTVADDGSALGHSFVTYVSNDNSTCNNFGTKTAQCERCSVTNTLTDESQSFKPHTYVGGKCEVCKASHLSYTLSEDETYYIVDGLANDCKESNIVIPEFENGLPVKVIGNHAFYTYSSNTYIKSFKLPSGITKIGKAAFAFCEALNSINIPDNVVEIGTEAFVGCKALRNINLPDGLRRIGLYAFSNSGITSMHIPESVSVDGDIFLGCNSLTEITIPDVGWICQYFGGTAPSASYMQDPNVPSTLKKVTVLSGVICTKAFDNCKYITTVVIGKNVSKVGDEAFRGCLALNKIFIESGVGVIENYAFSNNYNSAFPIVYCEDAKKPEAWSDKWNYIFYNYSYTSLKVVWDYKNA